MQCSPLSSLLAVLALAAASSCTASGPGRAAAPAQPTPEDSAEPTTMSPAADAAAENVPESPTAENSAKPATSTAGGRAVPPVPPAIAAAVGADDRSEEDRTLDAGRHPAEMLAFFGVKPSMRVAELMAGTGYTAELLARVVGPRGRVYAQNNRFVLRKFAEEPWAARLGKAVNANVVRVDRELEDPLPPEARQLDAVFLILFYHDTVWMKADRKRLNRAVYEALKPGGVYAVVDHSAREGAGLSEVKALHRIEESVVRKEIEAAGFVLDARGSFLRNPADTRDWNAAPSAAGERRGTSDRFALRFLKPR